eukprot:CAMPEP_0202509222 /NCGR_PEP_ID=MMETSP1361-20130828/52659_1 /ASSEMBLY_ACC=CAM_ASM_000849 /TAXON_ID=210615 /ORGANISM="Staurosira complex sp., Strain CCMP2646" /LENGTH=394 /DNA_ID=CAMNT_0049143431 /DNA_START=148 /DNA_END=1333 /DNA_ORIENTATION=-
MPTAPEEEVLQDLRHRHWTPLHDAPQPIDGSAIVAWDDSRAIITGGRNENDEATDSVFIYNKGTMETEMLPSMLQARSGHAASIVGSNLFVIGGGELPNRISMNSIEVLNLNDLLEWKRYPVNLEIARSHCSAVAVNAYEIYIIGGVGGGRILDSVEILNTSTETVSQGPPMTVPRVAFATSLLGDAIVVTGGVGRLPASGQMVALQSCEQLALDSDEQASRWQPLHSMNTGRAGHDGLSYGSCMVVVGGVDSSPPMTVPRVAFATSLLGDAIVVTGGAGRTPASEEMVALQSCELLALGSGEERPRWQPSQSNVVTKRLGHKGLAYGSCMVVVGGVDSFDRGEDNGFPHYITMTEVWNGATGIWTQLSASLPPMWSQRDLAIKGWPMEVAWLL